jgi:predicted GNAT family N-acyltransferase
MTALTVRVKLAETPSEWAGAVAVRLAIFVDEQGVPLTAEMDEHDRSAVHAVAILSPAPGGPDGPPGPGSSPRRGGAGATPQDSDLPPELIVSLEPARQGTALRAAAQAGKYLPLSLSGARSSAKDAVALAPVVGTGRLLRASGGVARIGRIAVLPQWRAQGHGSRILRLLEEAALARGATQILLHAQLPVREFYERRGYRVSGPAQPFLEDNIPHLRMTRSLSPDM